MYGGNEPCPVRGLYKAGVGWGGSFDDLKTLNANCDSITRMIKRFIIHFGKDLKNEQTYEKTLPDKTIFDISDR